MARAVAGFKVMGEAAGQVAAAFVNFGEAVVRSFVGAGLGQGFPERSGAPTSNDPSEGVNAAQRVSGRLMTMSDIDAAAADLGIELLPWQRRVAEAWLRREIVAFPTGKQQGRVALQRVVHHAHNRTGYAIPGAWIDEAPYREAHIPTPIQDRIDALRTGRENGSER